MSDCARFFPQGSTRKAKLGLKILGLNIKAFDQEGRYLLEIHTGYIYII